jgi:arginine/lysine/ornithine decarboxylase
VSLNACHGGKISFSQWTGLVKLGHGIHAQCVRLLGTSEDEAAAAMMTGSHRKHRRRTNLLV